MLLKDAILYSGLPSLHTIVQTPSECQLIVQPQTWFWLLAIKLLAVKLLAVKLLAVKLLAVKLLAINLLAIKLLAIKLLAVKLLDFKLLPIKLLATKLLALKFSALCIPFFKWPKHITAILFPAGMLCSNDPVARP
jgi:hypothetical protein